MTQVELLPMSRKSSRRDGLNFNNIHNNNNNNEYKFLNLDVSGVKFKILYDLLYQYPDTLLTQLAKAESENLPMDHLLPTGLIFTDNSVKEFHVSKSPKLFDDIVLQYYITGKLHVPEFMCKDTVQQEMKFWKLSTKAICRCWGDAFVTDEESSTKHTNSGEHNSGESKNENDVNLSKYVKIKAELWKICDFRNETKLGVAFSIVSVIFILVSIMVLILSTIRELEFCSSGDNTTNHISISDVEDYDISEYLGVENTNTTANASDSNNSNASSTKSPYSNRLRLEQWDYFSNCLGTRIFEIIDMVCIVWFTLEFFFRFFTCPNKRDFLKSPLNVVDALATFPYYIEVLVYVVAVDAKYLHPGSILVFRLSRSITVLRILKLARYFEDLRILGQTLKAARQELFMLFLFVLVSLLIVSTTVYQLEKDEPGTQFTSIPAACWWGIATLTTVGYGDMVPISAAGRVAGCFACITGIMMMAFPVSVLVEHFTNAYKKKKADAIKMQMNRITSSVNDNNWNRKSHKVMVVVKRVTLSVKPLKRLITKKKNLRK